MPRLAPKGSEKPPSAIAAPTRDCDRCGHAAAYQVDVRHGTLYFCAHHFNDHVGHILSENYNVIRLDS